ncbi:MAG TPA: flagellar basal body L-ring protein FlgH [Bryobacteraceae bacterium]|nr:flagellar basal body L-ring protein FlgH [Bryobacteraceae bacterium]
MKVLMISLLFAGTMMAKKPAVPKPTELELYLQQAAQRATSAIAPAPGAIWTPGARLGDAALDLRARHVDDIVTVVVEERASAVSRGSVSSSRNSSANARVDTALGPRTTGWLPNLAGLSSDQKLDGQGETVRETVLSTVLAARVTNVLPNGNLVIEGEKAVTVNAETQRVLVRGIVRPVDLSTGNAVRSDQIAMMEVSVAGRGVIGDAVRRPHFLYRLLLGLLPF